MFQKLSGYTRVLNWLKLLLAANGKHWELFLGFFLFMLSHTFFNSHSYWHVKSVEMLCWTSKESSKSLAQTIDKADIIPVASSCLLEWAWTLQWRPCRRNGAGQGSGLSPCGTASCPAELSWCPPTTGPSSCPSAKHIRKKESFFYFFIFFLAKQISCDFKMNMEALLYFQNQQSRILAKHLYVTSY